MSELKYTATQMNNVLSSSQEYYRNWKEAEKINKELRARISELSQAVGLITTLKPTMVMDADHPLDMAKEVEAYVTARIGELETDNAEFRQLIRDWSIVLEQDDGFQLWQVESVRQAMLEINKECEE